MFKPLRTERLLIRPFEDGDEAGLVARRNEPEVARFQDWSLPFTSHRAEEIVSGLIEMDEPQEGEWWMAVVCDHVSGETLGDLAVHLSQEGHTAEVGYTLSYPHWGSGYAVEALAAMVRYLFDDLDVTRVFGMLHPDNRASAMVLERTGFIFEGHTKSSFWLDGELSDDWIYGLTRPDWETWRNRPRHTPEVVELVEVNAGNLDAVASLRTHKTQEEFVAPMLRSFAHALFPEEVDGHTVVPWMRAVTADGELAGFVMLAIRTEHHPEPYLWRFLIDRLHQRRGIGAVALELVAEECLRMGDSTLLTSWVEGKGSPQPFYTSHGFAPTGRLIDGETEGRKRLA